MKTQVLNFNSLIPFIHFYIMGFGRDITLSLIQDRQGIGRQEHLVDVFIIIQYMEKQKRKAGKKKEGLTNCGRI